MRRYSQAGQIGLNDGFDRMRTAVENDLAWWDKRGDYPYDAILLHGAYSDNVAGTKHIAQSVTEWARHYAYPKVVLCANNDFFAYIEKNFADKIPTVRGDGGSWWEDGAGSTALETAVNRVAHQDVIAAEAAWAVVQRNDPKVAVPRDEFDRTWDNILLFDEHTWGAHNSIGQPTLDFVARQWAVKAAYATAAKSSADRLLEHGWKRWGPWWMRRRGRCWCSIPRAHPHGGGGGGDSAGQVHCRWRESNRAPAGDAGGPAGGGRVKFLAEDVPAVGYKTYRWRRRRTGRRPSRVRGVSTARCSRTTFTA